MSSGQCRTSRLGKEKMGASCGVEECYFRRYSYCTFYCIIVVPPFRYVIPPFGDVIDVLGHVKFLR